MNNEKRLVVGLCVTGSWEYWALAIVTLVSLKNYLDIQPHKVMIATDQEEPFELLKRLEGELDYEIERVVPRDFYAELVPKMKGNYATYWKFDLFNSLAENEILMYVDVDAFAVRKLNVRSVLEVLSRGEFSIAAVPSPRPVFERAAVTRLANPFDYFNAGVLFGTKDSRYERESIEAAYFEIMKFDTLNVYWHDQDIFNYLFSGDVFKLPYTYNVHTGYVMNNFRSPYLINSLAAIDVDENVQIAHISGDYLLTKKYHPYKNNIFKLVVHCLELLSNSKLINLLAFNGIKSGLLRLNKNATQMKFDYVLQCLGLRKRIFAKQYYLAELRVGFRMIKRVIRSHFHW